MSRIADSLPEDVRRKVVAATASGEDHVSLREPEPKEADEDEGRTTSPDDIAEQDIQTEVEKALKERGFWPRDDTHLSACQVSWYRLPKRGWYIHLHRCLGNPILLDVQVSWPRYERYLEFELKTAKGRLSPNQRIIIAHTGAKVYRSAAAAIAAVDAWIEAIETTNPETDDV
jgi:hypothetical protein